MGRKGDAAVGALDPQLVRVYEAVARVLVACEGALEEPGRGGAPSRLVSPCVWGALEEPGRGGAPSRLESPCVLGAQEEPGRGGAPSRLESPEESLCEACAPEEASPTGGEEHALLPVARSLQQRMLGWVVRHIEWAHSWLRRIDGKTVTAQDQRRIARMSEYLAPWVRALCRLKGQHEHKKLTEWWDKQGIPEWKNVMILTTEGLGHPQLRPSLTSNCMQRLRAAHTSQ